MHYEKSGRFRQTVKELAVAIKVTTSKGRVFIFLNDKTHGVTDAMAKRFFLETGKERCAGPHRWGGELLHTFVSGGDLVTTRTCSLCGGVGAIRKSAHPQPRLKQEIRQ